MRTGTGRVAEKRGDYHDALLNKRNTVFPFMASLFGGLSAHALRYMFTLRTSAHERAKQRRHDTTDDYVLISAGRTNGWHIGPSAYQPPS
jgi:hypothetical protein